VAPPAQNSILVVGGSGFVGSHLLPALKEAVPAAELIATGLSLPPHEAGVRWVCLDITDRGAVEALIETTRPTVVIHLAALATYRSSALDPDLAWKVNVFGTRYLAETCLRIVPECRFLHVGSGEVYGHSCNRYCPVSEEAPLEPGNVYAVTKAAADLAIGEMTHRGLNAIRVRPFNHTGPGQGDALFVPTIAAQIARAEVGLGEPVIRIGNLETARDLLDVRDVVRAYLMILQQWPARRLGDVFNISSGTAIPMRQLLDELISLAQVPLRVEQDPSRMRPSEVPHVAGDATRLHEVLGWAPRCALSETLSSVLDFWRIKTLGLCSATTSSRPPSIKE
jgi:GDP-4-dehydro-6-deoxy-D-mannose reductase